MEEEIQDLKQQVEYLKQQLNRQEKMASLGLLSAGIAHEIQNPLNFVINFSKMSAHLSAKSISRTVYLISGCCWITRQRLWPSTMTPFQVTMGS